MKRYRKFAEGEKIRLIYWTEVKNFGDYLSPYIVSKLSDSEILHKNGALSVLNYIKCLIRYPHLIHKFVAPFQKNLLAAGSVLNISNSKSIIWGSGFMNRDDRFYGGYASAVRGLLSERKMVEMGGMRCGVYGDPGLLLPLIYHPDIEKTYKVGIIPHWRETDWFLANFPERHIIDLRTDNVEAVVDDILSCENILSTSLHGLIVSHSYGIPALWIKRGYINTDGFKFEDYFSSVDIDRYEGFTDIEGILSSESSIDNLFEANSTKSLPNCSLQYIWRNLLAAAPFKIKKEYAGI